MRNITLSVDEETYRACRVKAAEAGTSVSALVREYLVRLVRGVSSETEFERLHRQQNEAIARIRRDHRGFSAGDRLTREEVHGRSAIRGYEHPALRHQHRAGRGGEG